MNKQIIVNMSVKDLDKSKAFFSALGYTFNPLFSNEHAALMIIGRNRSSNPSTASTSPTRVKRSKCGFA
jgi:hypothetical protein